VNNGQIGRGQLRGQPAQRQPDPDRSATGNLYETTNGGSLWSPIGNAAEFQANTNDTGDPAAQIQFSAIAYGPPTPTRRAASATSIIHLRRDYRLAPRRR